MDLNTHETMKLLTAEERDRFVAFQSLFESDGWRIFAEYALAKANAAEKGAAYAKSWDDNRQAVGYGRAWAEVSVAETQFMNEFEAIAAERRGESVNSDEQDEA